MLLYFVQNVFFKSKIILLCAIIAIQHTSSSKTSARKTQLAKQDRGRKRPLRKTRCRKFPVKLVLRSLQTPDLHFPLLEPGLSFIKFAMCRL